MKTELPIFDCIYDIENTDIEKTRDTIKRHIPTLDITTITEHESCDNYVIEVNERLIFRFPKKHDIAGRVACEVALLEELEPKISLHIPRLFYAHETFVGYHKISGTALTSELYDTLESQEKHKLALDIATFFYQVHKSLDVGHARTLGVRDAQWPLSCEILIEKLDKKLPDTRLEKIFQRMITWHDSFIVSPDDPNDIVVVHNDVHEKNIAFDTKNNLINGIFDFSDIAIGDRYLEFRYLYLISPELFEQAARAYAQLMGQEFTMQRVLYYYVATEFSRLTECLYGGCWMQDSEQIIKRLLSMMD